MSAHILVAAKRLAIDRTSEGICSFKFVQALVRAGHHVSCITSETFEEPGGRLPAWWPATVPLAHLDKVTGDGARAAVARATRQLAAAGSVGAYVDRKVNAACAYSTGYSFHVWESVARWRVAIEQALVRERPQYLVIRGAGSEFEPHLAMLGWKPPVPWIGHYHDPFPMSLYPAPYQRRTPVLSTHQEALHRTIVQSADALTFPGTRLLTWVLKGDLERFRNKAFVVPHISSDMPAAGGGVEWPADADGILEPGRFNLVHTGTLLRERNPLALLRGFQAFIGEDARRRQLARLVFVGRADQSHTVLPEWKSLLASGSLVPVERRVSYQQALGVAQAADALVILEALAPESPFCPAKLADYLWLRRPVLALSPQKSGTADILGTDYPLRVAPDDAAGVARALGRLWDRWSNAAASDLVPAERSRLAMSEGTAQHRLEEIFAFLSSTSLRRVS